MKKLKRIVQLYSIELRQTIKEQGKQAESIIIEDINCLKEIFNKLNELPFDMDDIEKSRYLKKINGTFDMIYIDEISENFIKGKFVNIDEIGAKQYEVNGELKFLNEKVPETANIAEISHFIIDLKEKLLIFEYNHKSSHTSSLECYINEKNNKNYQIKLSIMLDDNKVKKLESIKNVYGFTLTASTKTIELNKVANSNMFSGMDALKKMVNNDTDINQIIKVSMKTKRNKKNNSAGYNANEFIECIKNLTYDPNDSEQKFNIDIDGDNELKEKVRLNYSNQYISDAIIVTSSMSESNDFYNALIDAYNRIKVKYLNG